jgi:hypothetical protein
MKKLDLVQMESLQGGTMPFRQCFEKAAGSAECICLLAAASCFGPEGTAAALAGFAAGCL